MKRTTATLLLAAAMMLTACKVKHGTDAGKHEDHANNKTLTETNPSTLNGIEIKNHGVKVNRAFLSKESGDLVPADNTVALGEKISLVINIDDGWAVQNGKSYIGASEIITTDGGVELLNSGDLFASYDDEGLDPTDAKIITLKARITNQPETPVDHYIVTFRVWDKKGDGEIVGRYTFKVL